MSSAPLLSASHGLPGPNVMQDHPPFLRACHSPWRFIPQNTLVILRGTVLTYLTAVACMFGFFKLQEETDVTKWSLCFDFGMITCSMALVYHAVTFAWTFTHLYYPDPNDHEGSIETRVFKLMSLPGNMASLRKQFRFTMLYTTTCVFSFMNTIIYWFITRGQGGGEGGSSLPNSTEEGSLAWTVASLPKTPFSDLFGEGWFKPFIIFNVYGITSLVMAAEILLFNSIKRPLAIGWHVFSLFVSSGLYLGWAAIGKYLTGSAPFYWLDEGQIGSEEGVTTYCIGFVLLSPIMFILMQGLVGIREGLTRPRCSFISPLER